MDRGCSDKTGLLLGVRGQWYVEIGLAYGWAGTRPALLGPNTEEGMSTARSLKQRLHDGEIVVALRVPIETERAKQTEAPPEPKGGDPTESASAEATADMPET